MPAVRPPCMAVGALGWAEGVGVGRRAHSYCSRRLYHGRPVSRHTASEPVGYRAQSSAVNLHASRSRNLITTVFAQWGSRAKT